MTDDIYSIELSVGGFSLSVSGSQEFVEDQFFKLYEDYDVEELNHSGMGGSTVEEAENKGEREKTAKGDGKTINEYLADSGASTKQDNALVVGWYLEYIEGQEDFTASEVEAKGKKEKVPLGSRVKRDLNENAKKGYLHSPDQRDGEDTYWVTDSGEEYLGDEGIPI